jgi:hypothetical protein
MKKSSLNQKELIPKKSANPPQIPAIQRLLRERRSLFIRHLLCHAFARPSLRLTLLEVSSSLFSQPTRCDWEGTDSRWPTHTQETRDARGSQSQRSFRAMSKELSGVCYVPQMPES